MIETKQVSDLVSERGFEIVRAGVPSVETERRTVFSAWRGLMLMSASTIVPVSDCRRRACVRWLYRS